MKKLIQGFITYQVRSWDPKKPVINFSTMQPEKYPDCFSDTVTVCEHSFEVEVPDDFDPRVGLIAGLKEKERKARADFEKLCTDIRRQISQYEAISMDEPS